MFAQVEFGLCDEKECISIILDNEEQVNEFMLMLIEKSQREFSKNDEEL